MAFLKRLGDSILNDAVHAAADVPVKFDAALVVANAHHMQASGTQVSHHYFLFIPATPEHPQYAAGELLHHRPAEFVPEVPLTVVAYLGAAHVAAGWLGAFLMVEVNAGGNAVFWFGYFSHAGLP